MTGWRFIVRSHHPLSLLMLWSRDQVITWRMENVLFQLPRDLWLPNVTEWWVLMRACYLASHITCWSCGHIRSHDKWKRDLSLSNLTEVWLMIKQLNQSTIVTGNSMHLFNAAFCMHNFLTSEFYTFVLTLIIKNPAQTIEVFPF